MTTVLQAASDDGVLTLTLNRPEQMNSLSQDLIVALHEQIAAVADDRSVRVVVITGAGKAFCAGADLIEAGANATDPVAFRTQLTAWRAAFAAIGLCPKPVIAAVNGIALAGGIELALSCDLIVASERARLGDGHVKYGLVPGGGGSQRLTDAVGSRWARWLMYSGELLPAARAEDIGLVQQIFPAETFAADVAAFAATLARRSARAVAFMKRMSRPSVSDDGLDLEIEAAISVVGGVEAREGLAAFAAKREPDFSRF